MGYISWEKLVLFDLGSLVLLSDASILKDGISTIHVSIDPTS
jgi:hypothetical protein